MDKNMLAQRLAALEAEKMNAVTAVERYNGAIFEIKWELEEMAKAEAANQAVKVDTHNLSPIPTPVEAEEVTNG